MAISLNTNLNSIKAQGQAKKLNEDIQNSTEKIASGSRIIRASDDAASLSLSEKFKANIRSTNQSVRNANDAISVIQTIEGNLASISDISSRMRELSVQAASDTLTNMDKEFANKEFQQLKNEIERITGASKFNAKKSISGTAEILQSQLVDRAPESFDFRVGGGSAEGSNIIKFRPTQLMMSVSDFNLSNMAINTTGQARSSLGELDKVIQKVAFSRASLGGLQSQLSSTVNVSETTSENASEANSRVRDLDYASETARNMKAKIISEANLSVMAQANTSPQALLKLIS